MSLLIDSYFFPTRSWVKKINPYEIASTAISGDGSVQYGIVNVNGYGSVKNGFIYKSTNFGTTWTPIAFNGAWVKIATSYSGQFVLAAIKNDLLFVSTDYGQTWAAKAMDADWWDVRMSGDGSIQYAILWNSTKLYKSTSYGNTWVELNPGLVNISGFAGVAVSDDGNIVVITRSGWTDKSLDYGLTWSSTSVPGQFGPYDIEISNDGNYITVEGERMSTDGKIRSYFGNAKDNRGRPTSQIGINVSLNYGTSNDNSPVYGQNWILTTGSLFQNSLFSNLQISSDAKFQIAVIDGYIYTNSNYGF
jgi:hypothetical protein